MQAAKVAHEIVCPRCGSHRVHHSHLRGAAERVAHSLCGAKLRRCYDCEFRFAVLSSAVIPASVLHTFDAVVLILAVLVLVSLLVLLKA